MSRRRRGKSSASEKEKQLARALEPGDRYRESPAPAQGWSSVFWKTVASLGALAGLVVATRTLLPLDSPVDRLKVLEDYADHLCERIKETRDLTELRALEVDYQETIAKIGDIREQMRLQGEWPEGVRLEGGAGVKEPLARATPGAPQTLPEPSLEEREPEPTTQPDLPMSMLTPASAVVSDDAGAVSGVQLRKTSTAEQEDCPPQSTIFQLRGGLRLELWTPAAAHDTCDEQRRRHEALVRELARYWPGP